MQSKEKWLAAASLYEQPPRGTRIRGMRTRPWDMKEAAEKLGAQMEFGVKYPDMVSVYSVGPAHATEAEPDIPNAFSLEFCGGPHVANTKELGEGGKHFKILKEEASSAGVRRIKAVLQ